jgi:Flp pilus assembly protein TadG
MNNWSPVARMRYSETYTLSPAIEIEDGQSLVEAAVVLPVILLVVTGVLAFGLTFSNYILLTEATGVGARQLAISRGTTLDPCATVATAIAAAAPLLRSANLTYTIVLNGTMYTSSSCPSSTTTTGPSGKLQQGSTATVTVGYPCQLKVVGYDIVPGCSLTAQTAEAIQ